jgi:hypothetical protein
VSLRSEDHAQNVQMLPGDGGDGGDDDDDALPRGRAGGRRAAAGNGLIIELEGRPVMSFGLAEPSHVFYSEFPGAENPISSRGCFAPIANLSREAHHRGHMCRFLLCVAVTVFDGRGFRLDEISISGLGVRKLGRLRSDLSSADG